jgi:hypothetical protein
MRALWASESPRNRRSALKQQEDKDQDQTKDQTKDFSFEDMKYKKVVVIASSFTYQGVLLGADETDLYLKGQFRYLVLPMGRVTSIRLASDKDVFDSRKSVDPAFYSDPD